ncbi:YlxR family protein [Oligoflexia bacterium]|nr:YlxR family protein [Oligoflexia bacterium]
MVREPVRSCIICRDRAPKAKLLRFILKNGEVVWDEHLSLQGRGAYLHRRVACCSKIREGARWEHAFRLKRGALKKTKELLLVAQAVCSSFEGQAGEGKQTRAKIRL